MLTHPLLPKLRALHLSGILDTLDQRAKTAQEQSMAAIEFLALLLDDELERREQNHFHRRIKESGIEEEKTLSRFDFTTAPQVSKTLMGDLALCRFVEHGDNILFCGPTELPT